MKFLTLNAGSSSLKFALFDDEKKVVSGKVERLFFDPVAEMKSESNNVEIKEKVNVKTYKEALQWIVDKLMLNNFISSSNDVDAIAHRVVHGGNFTSTVEIDDKIMKLLHQLIPLAPLHNPANIETIKAARELFNCKHFAVFDTAFHQTMPNRYFLYAIPHDLNYRRYGFHGTSHKYVYFEAKKILQNLGMSSFNVATIHLGNGSSMALVSNDNVLHTTMGLTPLEGLVMGTRCGNIDPGIVIDLCRKKGIDEADKILNKMSGLKGLTGHSDIREIRECAKITFENIVDVWNKRQFNLEDLSERCQLAMIMLSDRIIQYLAWYEKIVNLDAIVFTAGIGEHIWQIRKFVALGMNYEIDDNKNERNELIISKENFKPIIMVIPTNEELQMVREVKSLMNVKR